MDFSKAIKQFDENYALRKKLELSDRKAMADVLEQVGGFYKWGDTEDKPIIAAYVYDEPQDVYVNKIENDNGYIKLNVTPKESIEDTEIGIEDVMDGHIQYILDYMNANIQAQNITGIELFSIEWDEITQQKNIHILAYLWKSDDCYRCTEYTFLILPLKEFVAMSMEEREDLYSEVKQYERDINSDDELIKTYLHYFDGTQADSRLEYDDITMSMPVGNYYAKC